MSPVVEVRYASLLELHKVRVVRVELVRRGCTKGPPLPVLKMGAVDLKPTRGLMITTMLSC